MYCWLIVPKKIKIKIKIRAFKSDPLSNSSSLSYTGSSMCKPGWSQDHPDLQKIASIHLPKKNYMDHPDLQKIASMHLPKKNYMLN